MSGLRGSHLWALGRPTAYYSVDNVCVQAHVTVLAGASTAVAQVQNACMR
jgi:hypothetical protein